MDCGASIGANPNAKRFDASVEPIADVHSVTPDLGIPDDGEYQECTDPAEVIQTRGLWIQPATDIYKKEDEVYIEFPSSMGQCLFTSNDGYTVIFDQNIRANTGNLYLQELPRFVDEVIEFTGVPSPWKNHQNLWLLECNSKLCPNGTGYGKGYIGNAVMVFGNDEIIALNKAASRGEIYNKRLLVHELSHTLRYGVAKLWWGLEEGLARYTELNHTGETREPKKDGGFISTWILCDPTGYYEMTTYYDESGNRTREESFGGIKPYVTLDSYDRTGTQLEYYTNGYCFWNRIGNNYGGHNTVQNIIGAIYAFAIEHQEEAAPFPFFQTVMYATGMSKEEAVEYFGIFSAPANDEFYKIGGICIDKP